MATPAETAALRSVGLQPQPPTFGLTVIAMPPLLDAVPMAPSLVAPSVRPAAFVKGRQLALQRLLERAEAAGAIGVVGVKFRERPAFATDVVHPTQGWAPIEFTAVGTPVSATTAHRPRRLMSAALSGVDVAALMLRGWCPSDVVVAATVEQWNRTRFRTQDAMAEGSQRNREVPGVTELVERARRVVRQRVHERTRVLGADGVLLPDAISIKTTASHFFVEATATGTAIVRLSSLQGRLGESSRMVIDTR